MCAEMRARIAVLVGVSAVAFSVPAGAQTSPNGGSVSTGTSSGGTTAGDVPAGAAPAPAPEPEPAPAPAPSPSSSGEPTVPASQQGSLTGTPNPNALGASAGDELRFSSHGFLRAPMRIGAGSRPACPAGTAPGTYLLQNGQPSKNTTAVVAAAAAVPGGGDNTLQTPCAGSGQSTTNFHSPMVPDDQYLDPRYTRQWEKDWTEVFLNYGNSYALGTVAFQGFGLTDAEHFTLDNISSQLGIAMAYVTLTPHLGPHIRLKSKIGAFWNKYGMSGKYDAGKYDTYLFGRTHVMGEVIELEADTGDLTFRLSEGFGVKDEELEFSPMSYPFPGFTMVPHAHVGVSYKKMIDFNAHLIYALSQDARAENVPLGGDGVAGGNPVNPMAISNQPDGHIGVTGAEIRFTGGVFGELYAGFSHVFAAEAQQVGPAIEPISSLGGYSGGPGQPGNAGSNPASPTTDYYGPNGIVDNYLGSCPKCTAAQLGTGKIDTVLVQYDFSFGYLWRKIQNKNASFWGDGPDVKMSLFGEWQSVSSTDTLNENPLVGDGVKKLKYGTDIIVNPVSWFGFGVRADYVQPTSLDAHESFGVLSPKVMFRSSYLSHEEVTAQYTHYFDGADVTAQPPNGPLPYAGGPGCQATYSWSCSVPDKNVFGVKATMWW